VKIRLAREISRVALLCLVLVAIGCARPTEYTRTTLSGFSIELPEGVVRESSTTRIGGKHVVTVAASSNGFLAPAEHTKRNVHLTWSFSSAHQHVSLETYKRDTLPLFMTTAQANNIRSRLVSEEVIAPDRWLFMLEINQQPVAVGVITCERLLQLTVVYGRYADAARQAHETRRLLQSVECALTDAHRSATVEASTRLPDTFKRFASASSQLYLSTEAEGIGIYVSSGDLLENLSTYRAAIQSMSAQRTRSEPAQVEVLMLAAPTPADVRKSSLAIVRSRTGQTTYVGTQYCEKQSVTLLAFWIARDPTDERARARLAQLGCPEDAATTTEIYSGSMEQACADGFTLACRLGAAGPM
jgi:hypothetical protein